MSGVIRWERPPPITRNPSGFGPAVRDWESIVADLRSKPGEWGLVALCNNRGTASQVANALRTCEYAALWRNGPFEATARHVDGEARVYARYVGDTPKGSSGEVQP